MEKHSTVELREARGLLNDLLARLAGKDGQLWLKRYKKVHRGENPYLPLDSFRKTTIVLGDKSTKELVQAVMQKKKGGISDFLVGMIGNISISSTKKEVELVFVPRSFLSTLYSSPEKFYKEAQEFGLELCPAEVGPQLFLQTEQIADKVKNAYIGMSPLDDFGLHPKRYIFEICKSNKNEGALVDLKYAHFYASYEMDDLFAFINPNREI